MFFFEKKNQNTFASAVARSPVSPRRGPGVFCFFFAKKKDLSLPGGANLVSRKQTYLTAAAFVLLGARAGWAQEVFRQPGTEPVAPPALQQDLGGVAPADPDLNYTQVPVPDRTRIINALGVPDNPANPYQQSTLKGDRPVFDDWFVQLNVINDDIYEPRAIPTPRNQVDTYSLGTNGQFGNPKQVFFSELFIPSISIIKGDTSFRPPDIQIRITPAINFTQLDVGELGITNIDPRQGTTRDDSFVGLQEAFIDYHIRDVSTRYDFDAIRVGIQPFNADFRGFLFQDDQLGVRLFGDRANNRFQYNLAYFRRIEKDTNSGLNDLGMPLRRDDILIGNLFVQDLPVKGFTTEFSVTQNWNHEEEFHYDKNGFLVRPAELGLQDPHKYDVTYFGVNGDGHFGRVNLTTSSYYAEGNDKTDEFTGHGAKIRSYFLAAEPSIDIDYIRIRGSFAYSSGQKKPFGNTETGFDAINENPQFAGADTSFYIRNGIPLIGGGGVLLVEPNGLLPNLRSSKDEGQSNFLNPGVLLLGVGTDVDILPELRATLNFNHITFNDTQVLEVLEQEKNIHHNFGWDISGSVTWRPFDTQNIILRTSAAVLLPGQGFKDLFASANPDQPYFSSLIDVILRY
jgi:hypothetical protein